MSETSTHPRTPPRFAEYMTPRRITIAALIVLTAAVIVIIAGPRGSIAEDGPEGTLALRRMLGILGLGGGSADEPPDRGTFVVLSDARTPDQSQELLEWVGRGNRLVLTDPGGQTAQILGVEPRRAVGGSLLGVTRIPAECAALEGVSDVAIRTTDWRLATDEAAAGCLGDPPVLIEITFSQGRIYVLGGRSPFTNELLDEADNAAFAVRLLAPLAEGPVAFGPPRPPGAEGAGLWATLPGGARAAAIAAAVALGLFALVRGRRLGMPPDEAPPTSLPQSALVGATGDLLQMSSDVAHTHALLRDATLERLRRRLGQPPGTPAADLARMVAATTGRDPDGVQALLTGPPAADSERLVHAARALERLTQDLTTGGSAPRTPSEARPTDPTDLDPRQDDR